MRPTTGQQASAPSSPARSGVVVSLLSAALLFSCAPTAPAESSDSVATTVQAAVPWTLGARFDATQSNIAFKVYSSRATRLELYLYKQPTGVQEAVKYVMVKDTATNVWSKTVSVSTLVNSYGFSASGPFYYGYRAWGPNWTYSTAWSKGSGIGFVADVDANGNRFNPNKLLLDPYSWEMSHDPVTPANPDGTLYASGPLYRNIDDGTKAPKGIVLAEDTTPIGTKPTGPLKDDLIYEVHVRGLTKNDPTIPAAFQGTYKGAGMKAASLASLGVTAVELLPVQETQNDTNDVNPNSTDGDNYWGYMTLNYFAPDRRYAADKSAGGPTREFKEMVQAFHNAGIKVYIDVVYNHTAEGGTWSAGDKATMNLYSWRGLDNPTYYSLTADRQFPWDNTGVGGNYNTYNPIAQNLIVDSLKYWRDVLGVDGFRFDLASVLGNTCQHGCFNYDKLDPGTALNRIWRDLSPRPATGGAGVDLIAEPWAIGGNSYQVGNFPSGWAEWNGRYRDTFRQAQNKLGVEVVLTGTMATRFAGSSDLYGDDGRAPYNSINFITAHDGFTLRDLYAYNNKNNGQAWPFGPSDGGEDHNNSWDQGGIYADQKRAARVGLGFLALSAGTPMINAGDEYLRTLQGNNNAYNLDSVANWLNYSWSPDQSTFHAYAKCMFAFRKAHPGLRPQGFYSGADNNGNGLQQLAWFKPDGNPADGPYFDNPDNHAISWRIDGSELGDGNAIYVAYNGWSGSVNFVLPWPGTGKNWYRVMDASNWAEGSNQCVSPGNEAFIGGQGVGYGLEGRSLLVLIAK
ncbi:MAG TPA: isoamylase [Myxococcaceae bacterium]|nr:isoamylase [Myxococcaceae bacterium]